MISYIAKKVFTLLLSLFLIVSLTFFLMHAIPGDPFTQEDPIPGEVLASCQTHYALNLPLHQQYLRTLQRLIQGDLGTSLRYPGRSVTQIIREGFSVSLLLGLEALCLALAFGVVLGSLAAIKPHRGNMVILCTLLTLSVPSFLLAALLQYLFALKLHLFPVARWESFLHTVLPALALAAHPTACIARLLRASVIDTLHQEFILTARAKGLSPRQVATRHILRGSLLPVIAYLAPLTAHIVTGSFAIEKVFGIPGLGKWFVSSLINRDYSVILGTCLFYGLILLACTLFVDLIILCIDPRIRYGSSLS